MFPTISLKHHARRFPEKVAIAFHDQKITYSELYRKVVSFASYLHHVQGITKGDRVGIYVHNCPEFAISYFAISLIGGISVIIDVRAKGSELNEIVENAKMHLIIVDHSVVKQLASVRDTGIEAIVVGSGDCTKGFVNFEEGTRYSGVILQEPSLDETDEAVYIYTSGSTGKPKGVVLTYRNLSNGPKVFRAVLNMDENSVLAIFLPMSHISGPLYCNEMADKGSTMVIIDQIRPETIFDAVHRWKVTLFHGVPPLFQLLIQYPHIDRYDLSSLKVVALMGMSVPLSLMKEVKAAFPHVTVIQGYGLTETSPYITVTDPDNAEKKMASIGKPVPGVEVEVVDAKGAVLPVGQVGEIITRGFHVMKEYHGLPHATREKLKDGWFYTGDIGKFDEDGYLYHLGRKDDMIITGGLNVYPAEIENVLSQIPDVWEVAAYGIQDALRGEVIYASVVLNPESPYGKDDLLAYCRENLARFKVPNKIEIKKELPKNNIGKIDKLALVKEAKTQYSST